MRPLAWLWLLALPAVAAPPSLSGGARERLVYQPALVHWSGELRFELVECQRLEVAGERLLRAILRVTARDGGALDELAVLGEPLALVDGERLPAAELATGLRDGAVWWFALTFPDPGAERLTVLSGSIGPRPGVQRRQVSLALDELGRVAVAESPPVRLSVALLRREADILPVDGLPVPLESMLESTQGSLADPPEASDQTPYLTLRLHTLDQDDEWRLSNLRLRHAAGSIDHWRYLRRLWRPDWGGWLGATGRDSELDGRAAVLLEEVAPSSPAALAGLAPGDLLLSADGLPCSSAFALAELVRRLPAGREVAFLLSRAGAERTVAATLEGRPLWPDREPLEFEQAWQSLGGAEHGGVLSQWDFQTWSPQPADLEPLGLDLLYERPEPARGTSFVFHDIPLSAPRG